VGWVFVVRYNTFYCPGHGLRKRRRRRRRRRRGELGCEEEGDL